MKRFHIAAMVVAVSLTLFPLGGGQARVQGAPVNSDAEARELARQALDGRDVLMRLYLDWRTDPKAYTVLPVTLAGLDVTFDAIKAAYAQSQPAAGSSDAQVEQQLAGAICVVTAIDQQDATISAVLRDFVYVEPYTRTRRFTLWPGSVPPAQKEPCVFTDALNQPIPNAEVKIYIGHNVPFPQVGLRVWIANDRTDENGHMVSMKSTSSICFFLYTLIHPDCGPVPAQSRYWMSQPGAGHPVYVPALPREQWCVFLDALGNPIPGATVDVFDGWTWSPPDQATVGRGGQMVVINRLIESIVLDEAGSLRPPHARPLLDGCCFCVRDPNYGIALVEPYDKMHYRFEGPLTTCVVPLVAAGTRADERSLWGTVVDPNGVPIPNAIIKCNTILTPGGGRLQAFFPGLYLYGKYGKYAKVLTDSKGRFAMHVPLTNQDGTLGWPVPPGAEYVVTVEAPAQLGLAPCSPTLAGGQEHMITLYPPAPIPTSYAGTLVFVDESGPVTDPDSLTQVRFTVTKTGSDGGTLISGTWPTTVALPFGIYSAVARWNDKLYAFQPVEVTPASPDSIVFTIKEIRPARRTFHGRVVHGVTGLPMAQAIVMCRPGSNHVRAITDDPLYQDEVYYFGPEIDPNSELFHILEQNPDVGVTRTGPDGRYQITTSVEWMDSPDSILAIKQDLLGFRQILSSYLSGVNERVPLPDMKLFPAATVLLEPNVPGESSLRSETRLYYHTMPDDPTPWVKDLWGTSSSNPGGSVFRTTDLRSNQLQRVYVPADVTLKLEVKRLGDRHAPVFIEGVRLAQGEVLDLGRVDFPPAMQIIVKVTDSAGKPLEGIGVMRLDPYGNRKGGPIVTDGDGLAHLYVPPHSHGQFIVMCQEPATADWISEGIPYQVGGYEDTQKEFTLRLSHTMIQLLSGGKQ